jgi:hypothetical protein
MENKSEILKVIFEFLKERRFDSIIKYIENILAEIPTTPIGKGDRDISDVLFFYASSLWEVYRNRNEVLKYACMSLQYNRENEKVLWLIRECKAVYSGKSKYYQIDVKGEYLHSSNGKSALIPFTTIYGVVAETPEQALQYIKEIERDEIKESLVILRHREISSKPELPQGVYSMKSLVGIGII